MTSSADLIRPVKVLIGPSNARARLMADTDTLLEGIDAEVLTYGVFTGGTFPTAEDRCLTLPVTAGPSCYGAAACANFGLSLAFRPERPYNVATLFMPDFDPSRQVCSESVHAIGDLINPNVGLVWWLSSGVMHVSAALVEQIGYPDPSLPDRAFPYDYALRATGAGFNPIYGGLEPPPDDVVAALEARYPGYAEAAYQGVAHMGRLAQERVGRVFIGPMAGLVDLGDCMSLMDRTREPGVLGTMNSDEPIFTRFRAYVSQAYRLTE